MKSFAKSFCQILEILSDSDPCQKDCMNKKIDSTQWVFEFAGMSFFITTFLPCYPHTNPRYTYDSKNCFILFQPEVSFALKNISNFAANTNWDQPSTERDKIRVSFKSARQTYHIPTRKFPIAYEMIKPMHEQDPAIKWWSTASWRLNDDYYVNIK